MAVSTRVDVADIDRKIVKPFMATAEQIRKAERMAIKDALKSTRGKGRKKAAEEYAIKPAGKKKLFDSIKTVGSADGVEEGRLRFSGEVGTALHDFPGSPAKTPAAWLKKGDRPGLNPRLRTPKEGVRVRYFKGGVFQVRMPLDEKGKPVMYKGTHVTSPAKTFWVHLKDRNKWVLAYRKFPAKYRGKERIPFGMSRKGLFGPSLIQAVGRRDVFQLLTEHARERYGVRLAHYLEAYLKGILT